MIGTSQSYVALNYVSKQWQGYLIFCVKGVVVTSVLETICAEVFYFNIFNTKIYICKKCFYFTIFLCCFYCYSDQSYLVIIYMFNCNYFILIAVQRFKDSEETEDKCSCCEKDTESKSSLICSCGHRDKLILTDYLQLRVNLEQLYEQWSESDPHFKQISKHFTGIRMLRQDPVECLFAFICSSNNNISRISSMVGKLAAHYGEKIVDLDGQEYYTFPRVSALAKDGVEDHLRSLGFGYRAKYIQVGTRYNM